jgi:diaminopimelate decarboxylase
MEYIMKILKSAGMGADCSSMAELILSEKGKYEQEGRIQILKIK